jgi:hypothetical protein
MLAALRQILQTTVSEQMAALEARLIERFDVRFAARDGDAQVVTERIGALETWLAGRLEARLAARDGEALAVTERIGGLETRVARTESRLMADAAAQRDAINVRLMALEAAFERAEAAMLLVTEQVSAAGERAAGAADVQKVDARVEALLAEVKDQRKGSRDEVARALTTATYPLQRAIETSTIELRKWLANEASTTVSAAMERLGAKADAARLESAEVRAQVDSLLLESRMMVERLQDVTAQVRTVDVHVARRLTEASDVLRALGEKTDGRAEALQKDVAALIEEQKKKKGWFS